MKQKFVYMIAYAIDDSVHNTNIIITSYSYLYTVIILSYLECANSLLLNTVIF